MVVTRDSGHRAPRPPTSDAARTRPAIRVQVRIDQLTVKDGGTLNHDDLIKRVEAEIRTLLLQNPRAIDRGPYRAVLPGFRITTAAPTSIASVAQAVGAAVHLRMLSGEGRA